MHALWDIPELVQLIFRLADRETLRNLTQVCRSFWLQAFPFLWRRVQYLNTLLCLLPENAISRTRNGRIDTCPFIVTRALDKSDWDRFMLHSQHIRHLPLSLYEQDNLLKLAPHLPSTPIMPNLSSVRLEIRKLEVDSEVLGHFLPPSVTDLVVQAIGQAEDGQRFLNALATEMKLPHLRSFSIAVGSRPEKDVGSSVSQVLRSHQGIESLAMDIGDSHQINEVLRLAGELPRLRQFEISHYDGTVLSLDYDSFPALESLKLSSDLHRLDPLLVWVPSERIRCLRVAVKDPHASQDGSGPPLADSFRTIGTFTHLKVLSVWLEVVDTWETIHHLLGCKELEGLTMMFWRHDSELELQEGHLEQMGRAWRSLKTLRLHLYDPNAPETAYLKLSYLRVIATEFRNLQLLSIQFDARAASSSRFSPSDLTAPAQSSLRKLDVGRSLLDKEGVKVIARLLASWWPNLQKLASTHNVSTPRWSAVLENYRSYIS